MGMFDYLRCKMPLPLPEFQDAEFQTKCTPAQYMDLYVIDETGKLWVEEYDTEDQSDPNAEGFMKFAGCAARVNKRMAPVAFTGSINFYECLGRYSSGWVEFCAFIDEGQVIKLKLIEHRPEDPIKEQATKEQHDTLFRK